MSRLSHGHFCNTSFQDLPGSYTVASTVWSPGNMPLTSNDCQGVKRKAIEAVEGIESLKIIKVDDLAVQEEEVEVVIDPGETEV